MANSFGPSGVVLGSTTINDWDDVSAYLESTKPTISTTSLPDGGGSSATYNQTISATDPQGSTISFSIQSGSLPTGLSLNSSTGAITGTISNLDDGTSTFTVRVEDANGNFRDQELSIKRGYLHNLQNGHTPSQCVTLGGEFLVSEGICRFSETSIGTATAGSYTSSTYSGVGSPIYSGDMNCPSGWSQYNNYSTMEGCSSTTTDYNASLGIVTCGVPQLATNTTGTGNRDSTDPAATYNVNGRAWADSTSRPSYYVTRGNCSNSCDNGCTYTHWSGYDYYWAGGCGSRTTTYLNIQARRSQIGCV